MAGDVSVEAVLSVLEGMVADMVVVLVAAVEVVVTVVDELKVWVVVLVLGTGVEVVSTADDRVDVCTIPLVGVVPVFPALVLWVMLMVEGLVVDCMGDVSVALCDVLLVPVVDRASVVLGTNVEVDSVVVAVVLTVVDSEIDETVGVLLVLLSDVENTVPVVDAEVVPAGDGTVSNLEGGLKNGGYST